MTVISEEVEEDNIPVAKNRAVSSDSSRRQQPENGSDRNSVNVHDAESSNNFSYKVMKSSNKSGTSNMLVTAAAANNNSNTVNTSMNNSNSSKRNSNNNSNSIGNISSSNVQTDRGELPNKIPTQGPAENEFSCSTYVG